MVWWFQNFRDRGQSARLGMEIEGETRNWSETAAGSLAWKALTPPCVRTPERAQLSPVPLWVHPAAPDSKLVV